MLLAPPSFPWASTTQNTEQEEPNTTVKPLGAALKWASNSALITNPLSPIKYWLLIFVSTDNELGGEKKIGQWLLREAAEVRGAIPRLRFPHLHSSTLSQALSACPGKERNPFILITYMSSHGRLNCICWWPRQSVCNVCTTSLHLLHLTSHRAHTFWILTEQ